MSLRNSFAVSRLTLGFPLRPTTFIGSSWLLCIVEMNHQTSSFSSPIWCGFVIAQRMETDKPKTLHYKRSRFVTQLPVDYLYSPSHGWIARQEGDLWRVGFTKFAVRMLGDMVDHGFEIEPGAPVQPGQIVGWIEGFKAISDLFCIAEGNFAGANPLLKERITVVNKDPYGEGWLYMVKGKPDSKCVDVHGYRAILDKTIDKILEKHKSEEIK